MDWLKNSAFDLLANGFAARFGVQEIIAQDLQSRFDGSKPTLLIDTREKDEQDVSIISGAVLVSPAQSLTEVKELQTFVKEYITEKNQADDPLVVVYCTAGYRSARSISHLPQELQPRVLNLHGGIIAWVNALGTVVGMDGEPSSSVHGYNLIWAKFINTNKIKPIVEWKSTPPP